MEEKRNTDPPSKWEHEEEQLLKEWAEKAMCFKWLHTKANKKYSKINMKVTIPVIILSTLTGTANFAQERIPKDQQSLYVMIVGSFNIIAGVITTIAQYFKISEINEGHRIAALSWDKFSRNIRIQLTKRPKNRDNSNSLMRYAKDEFDRLMEVSPDIPDEIIEQFKKTFIPNNDPMKILHSEYSNMSDIPKEKVIELLKMKSINTKFNKPELCDNLSEISIYQGNENENEEEDNIKDKFKQQFKESRGRSPTKEEIEIGIKILD